MKIQAGSARAKGRWIRSLGPTLAVAVAALIYWAGWLDFVEMELDELRYRAFVREPSPDLVIVAIDPPSLRELGTWPWPRTYHADVIRRLAGAGVHQIGIDIDFSSASRPDADLDLQRALIEADGRVVLPVFRQLGATPHGPVLHVAAPLPLLQPYARLASVNVKPDTDGVVRTMEANDRIGDAVLPSLATALVQRPEATLERFGIDYSIDVATMVRLSFADVLASRFDPTMLAGKTVLIGATAIELGDQIPVPVYKSLSGVLIHGLAYQSVVADRAIDRLPRGLVILVCAASAFALHAGFKARSWQRNLLVLAAFSSAVVGGSATLFLACPLLVDATPILLVGILAFGLALVTRIDEQSVHLLLERLRLARTDALLQRIVDDSFDGIFIVGSDGLIQRCNGPAAKIFGAAAAGLPGSPVSALIPSLHGAAPGRSAASFLEPGAHDLDCRRADGKRIWAELSVSRMHLGTETVFLAIVRDVSARKRYQAHLEHIAHHDALTDLPNRLRLTQTIDGLLAPGGAGETAFAILIVDLERFKDINDTLGHDVGDTLLRDTAARLRTLLPTGDHVARLAGDQFCILAPGAGDAAGAEALARHVIQSIETPFRLNEIAIDIGATVGIARYPGDGTDAATLLRCADIALHATKHDGSGIGFYDGAQDKTSVRHLGFTSDLRRAIAGPEMMLAFQPKIDLRSGHVCGAEALVRWRHPDRGFIPPDQFIAHAEVTGLIHPLTYRILGEGVETLSQLHRCGRHLRMSLNLSAKNLYDGNLPDALLALVREARADPAFIVLEITESAMMHDPDRAVATANRLRSSGFGLSIDDYGTGFSSLAYLKRLPVQELKIDRSFVMDMHTDSTDAQIVKSTIAMAHDLDLRVVAEGIELSTHVDMLSTLGCDEGQGYFFSRPLLLADFQTWLSDRERTLTAA